MGSSDRTLDSDALQEGVAELPGGIELPAQTGEVRHPGMDLGQRRSVESEALAPVRTRTERSQRCLDGGQRRVDRGRVQHPGEVQANDLLVVRATEPQRVRSDRADLADLEQRADEFSDAAQRRTGIRSKTARHEVLALQLRAP